MDFTLAGDVSTFDETDFEKSLETALELDSGHANVLTAAGGSIVVRARLFVATASTRTAADLEKDIRSFGASGMSYRLAFKYQVEALSFVHEPSPPPSPPSPPSAPPSPPEKKKRGGNGGLAVEDPSQGDSIINTQPFWQSGGFVAMVVCLSLCMCLVAGLCLRTWLINMREETYDVEEDEEEDEEEELMPADGPLTGDWQVDEVLHRTDRLGGLEEEDDEDDESDVEGEYLQLPLPSLNVGAQQNGEDQTVKGCLRTARRSAAAAAAVAAGAAPAGSRQVRFQQEPGAGEEGSRDSTPPRLPPPPGASSPRSSRVPVLPKPPPPSHAQAGFPDGGRTREEPNLIGDDLEEDVPGDRERRETVEEDPYLPNWSGAPKPLWRAPPAPPTGAAPSTPPQLRPRMPRSDSRATSLHAHSRGGSREGDQDLMALDPGPFTASAAQGAEAASQPACSQAASNGRNGACSECSDHEVEDDLDYMISPGMDADDHNPRSRLHRT